LSHVSPLPVGARLFSMASSVLGDTAELARRTIVATASHRVQGVSGSFHFPLSSAPGVSKYFESHAKVLISGPVTVSVNGPVSQTVATSAAVAVCPAKYDTWPVSEDQVVQLQGCTRIQHSLLVPPTSSVLRFGNETAEQLKPKTLVDYPPEVVGFFSIAGGTAQSSALIVLTVPLTVEGVAHHKTW
jgi:hypothetical protein